MAVEIRTIGSEQEINARTDGNQVHPMIEALRDDSIVVTWKEANSLYGRHLGTDGSYTGSDFLVENYISTHSSLQTRNYSIVSLEDDRIGAVWQSDTAAVGKIFNKDGVSGPIFGVGGGPANSLHPALDSVSNGNLLTAYVGNSFIIGGGQFTTNGARRSLFTVNDETGSHPAIATFSDDSFVAGWNSGGGALKLRLFWPDAWNKGASFSANDASQGQSQIQRGTYPVIDDLSENRFLVVWETLTDGSESGIRGRIFNSLGTPETSQFQINTHSAGDQKNPSVAVLGNGSFVVVWESPGDGSDNGIVGRLFNADGTTAGDEFQINTTTTGTQANPDVAALGESSFVVTWQSLNGSDGYDIYTQRFDAKPNMAPLATEDQYSIGEDAVLVVPSSDGVLANDTDGDDDILTTQLVTQPSHGVLEFGKDGEFTYIPEENYFGVDNFAYKATDGNNDSSTATVTITIQSINDVPVAEPDNANVDEDDSVTIMVLTNDHDVDDVNLSIESIDRSETKGSVVVDPNGQAISYTADADEFDLLAGDQTALDTFEYSVRDEDGGLSSATVSLTVKSVDDNRTITGTNQPDTLLGTSGEDMIQGLQGNDLLRGSSGVDALYGDNGNDQLFGDSGIDRLYGSRGDDALNGGAGNDLLDGGQGNDRFIFEILSGQDIIEDFDVKVNDQIGLLGIPGRGSMTELEAYISDAGADTRIDLASGNSITVTGVSSSELTSSDFFFA